MRVCSFWCGTKLAAALQWSLFEIIYWWCRTPLQTLILPIDPAAKPIDPGVCFALIAPLVLRLKPFLPFSKTRQIITYLLHSSCKPPPHICDRFWKIEPPRPSLYQKPSWRGNRASSNSDGFISFTADPHDSLYLEVKIPCQTNWPHHHDASQVNWLTPEI